LAASKLKKAGEQPEMTGEMPALKNMLESCQKMSDTIGSYHTMLSQNVNQLRSAGHTLVSAEAGILMPLQAGNQSNSHAGK